MLETHLFQCAAAEKNLALSSDGHGVTAGGRYPKAPGTPGRHLAPIHVGTSRGMQVTPPDARTPPHNVIAM